MTFQAIVTPGGIFACTMFGAICRCQRDSFMLTENGLLQMLCNNLMPSGNEQERGNNDDGLYSLYDDLTYLQYIILVEFKSPRQVFQELCGTL